MKPINAEQFRAKFKWLYQWIGIVVGFLLIGSLILGLMALIKWFWGVVF